MSGVKGDPRLKRIRAMAPAVPAGLARPQGGGSWLKLNVRGLKFDNLAPLLFKRTPQVKGLTYTPGARHGTVPKGDPRSRAYALRTLGGSFR